METAMSEPMSAPSFQQLHQALTAFITTAAGVAYVRSETYGPRRFALLSQSLAKSFAEQFTDDDANMLISDFDEPSKPALAAIYEELIYISKRYEAFGKILEPNLVIPGPNSEYEDDKGDPFSQDAVNEIDVVKGSVDFILEKLPKWARRILEAIMEVLKISRGAI